MKPYYEEKDIVIYKGDCREILPQLPQADAVITSPPYNTIKTVPKPSGMHKESKWVENTNLTKYEDDRPEGEYQAWLKEIVTLCLDRSPIAWINHKIRYRQGVGIHPLQFLPFPIYSEIIWVSNAMVAFNCRRYVPAHEVIYGFGYPNYWDNQLNSKSDVWKIRHDDENSSHPCSFPLQIPSRLIVSSVPKYGLVIEPFMGSGTTLLAAKNLRRRAIGIELEEKYCELAIQRLQQEVLPFEAKPSHPANLQLL